MKKNNPIIIPCLLVSVIFFTAGLLCYKIIFSFFEPTIPGITFEIISIHRVLKTSLLFSIVIGTMPLITSYVWILLSLSFVKRFISILIITSCISFAIFLRHQAVTLYFKSIVSKLLLTNKTHHFSYPIDPRHFVYNIIVGFFIGCLISCLLAFGKNSKSKPAANKSICNSMAWRKNNRQQIFNHL